MKLQDFVKYLVCILAVNLISHQCDAKNINFSYANKYKVSRQERGLLDLLVSPLRICGNCHCGRANHGSARFIGGEETDPHEFPWLAKILVKPLNKTFHGVLINDRYVLTAATPLMKLTPNDVKVFLGEYDSCSVDISSTLFSVDLLNSYPEFSSNAHDLMLIRLSRPTKIEKRISSVCLPNPDSTYLGQVGTVISWFNLDNSTKLNSCPPKKIGLPILGKEQCIKYSSYQGQFQDDFGCLGVVGQKSPICQNDVGTPVLYRSYFGIYDLVGIVSNTNDCGEKEPKAKLAAYTRVSPHLDWILQNTKDACYCSK